MRICFITICSSTVLGTYQRIPFFRGPSGDYEFPVSRPLNSSCNETFAIELDLSARNFIPRMVGEEIVRSVHNTALTIHDGALVTSLSLPRPFVSSTPLLLLPRRTGSESPSSRMAAPQNWKWGLHPFGPFIEYFGPVTVLLNANSFVPSELQLNTTLDSFRAQCFNCSYITFPLSAFGTPLGNEVLFDLRMPSIGTLVRIGGSEEETRLKIIVDALNPHLLMTVPEDIVQFVRAILVEDGAEERQGQIFQDCNQDILDQLPDMVLNFSFPDDGLISQLVLTPLDYMFMYPEQRSCRMGIANMDSFSNEAIIDLMQLAGINLHISRFAIQVCDGL